MDDVGTSSTDDSGDGGITSSANKESATDGSHSGRCVRECRRRYRIDGKVERDMSTPATTTTHRTSQSVQRHRVSPSSFGPSNATVHHGSKEKKIISHDDDNNNNREAAAAAMCINTSLRGGSTVCELPVSILDVVFSFLTVEDLCTVLAVSPRFYGAVNQSDRTAWKAACFSAWNGKQGFGRVVKTWPATEAACRSEELEVIAIQQQMFIHTRTADAHTVPATTYDWAVSLEEKEKHEEKEGNHYTNDQERLQLSFLPHCGGGDRSVLVSSLAKTSSERNSLTNGAGGTPYQLPSRSSLQNTLTYDAIMSSASSPHFNSSLVSPIRRSVSSFSSSGEGGAAERTLMYTEMKKKQGKLYWWQMSPEQKRRQLYRMQQESQSRRLVELQRQMQTQKDQQNYYQKRHEENGSQLMDEYEEEMKHTSITTTTTATTTTSSNVFSEEYMTGRRHKYVKDGICGSPQSHVDSSSINSTSCNQSNPRFLFSLDVGVRQEEKRQEQSSSCEEEDDDDDDDDTLYDSRSDSEAYRRHHHYYCNNAYQEFEEEMALTHSLSLLQYAQRKAHERMASRNKEKIQTGKETEGNYIIYDDGEENENEGGRGMRLPVSWKFAYYMSLRDAQRQRLTMQELMEAKWFVCFRNTGKTHPLIFTANHTVLIYPPIHTSRDVRMHPRHSRTREKKENNIFMPPLSYNLQKSGLELIVHNFPPLKVRRRSSSTTTVNTTHGNNEIAERIFRAEPEMTLRLTKLNEEMLEESYGKEDKEDKEKKKIIHISEVLESIKDISSCGSDWGWVMQNFFVKIFTVEIPVPWYIHQLRRTCETQPLFETA